MKKSIFWAMLFRILYQCLSQDIQSECYMVFGSKTSVQLGPKTFKSKTFNQTLIYPDKFCQNELSNSDCRSTTNDEGMSYDLTQP